MTLMPKICHAYIPNFLFHLSLSLPSEYYPTISILLIVLNLLFINASPVYRPVGVQLLNRKILSFAFLKKIFFHLFETNAHLYLLSNK